MLEHNMVCAANSWVQIAKRLKFLSLAWNKRPLSGLQALLPRVAMNLIFANDSNSISCKQQYSLSTVCYVLQIVDLKNITCLELSEPGSDLPESSAPRAACRHCCLVPRLPFATMSCKRIFLHLIHTNPLDFFSFAKQVFMTVWLIRLEASDCRFVDTSYIGSRSYLFNTIILLFICKSNACGYSCAWCSLLGQND